MSKLAKRVDIEVLDRDNQRVIMRRRVLPDPGKDFSPAGVDNILETFVEDFDSKNPGHKYRVARLMKNGCPLFKFVWDPKRDVDATFEDGMKQVERLEAAAG